LSFFQRNSCVSCGSGSTSRKPNSRNAWASSGAPYPRYEQGVFKIPEEKLEAVKRMAEVT